MKLVTRPIILMTAFAILFADGCRESEESTSVDQDRIFQLLVATYDADAQIMDWTASFTFGGPLGTTLELVEPSAVTINDDKMELIKAGSLGAHYHREMETTFSASPHEFIYKNADGKVFTNSVVLNSAELPVDLPLSFNKANGLTLAWTGSELDDDVVILTIKSKNSEEIGSVRESASGASEITITAEDLEKVPTGEVEVQLHRYSEWRDVTQGTAVGGSIKYNYYSVTKTIQMTE